MDLRKELEAKLTTQSKKYSAAVKKIRELTATRKKTTADADIKKINDQIAVFQKTADASSKEYNRLVKLRKDAKSYDSLSVAITKKEADLTKAEARGENVTALKAALTKARNDRSKLVPNLGNLVEPETKADPIKRRRSASPLTKK
jgi:Tol biopolymer transport system component